jgi:uncharacterized protein YjbI with pentapeptide repeats
LDESNSTDVMFENANLEGVCRCGTILLNASLKNADLCESVVEKTDKQVDW